jgi:hypothetical protein
LGQSPHHPVRENLFGYEAIKAFRAARSPAGLARSLSDTVITAYGRDSRDCLDPVPPRQHARQGRKTNADLDAFPEGWRVVAAHVSVIAET